MTAKESGVESPSPKKSQANQIVKKALESATKQVLLLFFFPGNGHHCIVPLGL
jgi:hypothetical protein